MRFRALLRKEYYEAFRAFIWNQKTGKKRSPGQVAGFACLYLLILSNLVNTFRQVFSLTAAAWIPKGFGAQYISHAIIISSMFGLFLSAIMVYSSLFKAKDNEILLSLPVKPWEITCARLFSVYVTDLLLTAMGLATAFVLYFRYTSLNPLSAIAALLYLIIVPGVTLTIAGLLGFLVGLLTARMRHKQAGITVLTLAGALGIGMVFARLSGLSASDIGSQAPVYVFPLDLAGEGFVSNPLSLLLFVLVSVLFIFAVIFIISRGVVRILGVTEKQKRVKYRSSMVKASSAWKALMEREKRKVFSNALYVLNCMTGSLVMMIAAVVLFIFSSKIGEMLGGVSVPVSLFAGLICLMCAVNDVTAPSVSTEGKAIWLIQSLPVDPLKVLAAKVRLHFVFTWIPALILAMGLCLAFGLKPADFAVLVVVSALYVLVSANLGLFNDLRHGSTSYMNEAVAIKQSMSVLYTLGEGILLAVLIFVPSIVFSGKVNGYILCLVYAVVLGVLLYLLTSWKKKDGVKAFMSM